MSPRLHDQVCRYADWGAHINGCNPAFNAALMPNDPVPSGTRAALRHRVHEGAAVGGVIGTIFAGAAAAHAVPATAAGAAALQKFVLIGPLAGLAAPVSGVPMAATVGAGALYAAALLGPGLLGTGRRTDAAPWQQELFGPCLATNGLLGQPEAALVRRAARAHAEGAGLRHACLLGAAVLLRLLIAVPRLALALLLGAGAAVGAAVAAAVTVVGCGVVLACGGDIGAAVPSPPVVTTTPRTFVAGVGRG